MPLVEQDDYVDLGQDEIEAALTTYIKNKYNRDPKGKFHYVPCYGRNSITTFAVRVSLTKEK